MSSESRAAIIHGFDHLVDELGGDSMRVTRKAGLDLADIQSVDAMIPSQVVKDVLDWASSETSCDHFGLLLAGRRNPEDYLGLLGQIVHSAPTLGVALKKSFSLFSIHSQASLWQLHTSEEVSYISYALLLVSDKGNKQVQQLVLTLLWRIVQAITQYKWHPTMVSFTFDKPANITPYQQVFDVPVMFNRDFCGVIFHSADLGITLPSYNADRHEALLELGLAIAKRKPRSFSEHVRVLIRKNLEMQRVGEDSITQFLPFERRTLQRKLKGRGTSYRRLLNEVRLNMAKELLVSSEISITRIAERLGYSGVATMTRAFKNQIGLSPSAWRKRHIFL